MARTVFGVTVSATVGLVLIAVGIFEIYRPAALIFGGLALLGLCYLRVQVEAAAAAKAKS